MTGGGERSGRMLRVERLRCSDRQNPMGTDRDIRLNWQLESDSGNIMQRAYRIVARGEEGELLWDSGVVISSRQQAAWPEDIPLRSRQRVLWRVEAEDSAGNTAVSEEAFFQTALLEQTDWRAKWIIHPEVHDAYGNTDQDRALPSYLFRKEFSVGKKIRRASLYICGLGFFTARINGRPVSDEVLAPAFTRYDRRTLYASYDITPLLQEQNALAVSVGNGRYNGFSDGVWNLKCEPWRSYPKLIAQIHLDYADGTEQRIGTDKSWKTHPGPSYFNCIDGGERYDARLAPEGWEQSGYDDSQWTAAEISRGTGGLLYPSTLPPIRITQSLRPLTTTRNGKGTVYDFGQNLSGWVRITVAGEPGAVVSIRMAEQLREGDIYHGEIASQYADQEDFQLDRYTLDGQKEQTWEPSFTYHGFRYARISVTEGKAELREVLARCVHTDLEPAGSFHCSHSLLNQIHHMCVWSTKTNFHGIPTDCPSREKRGWTGDAVTSAEQALFNFDMGAAYSKWLEDFRDCQRPDGSLPGVVPTGYWGYTWGNGPAWDAALLFLPWYMYVYTDNLSILKKTYPMMARYMRYLEGMADGGIVEFGLGDWNEPNFGQGYQYPLALSDTAFYKAFADILSKIAALLGFPQEAAEYRRLAADIKRSFRERFILHNKESFSESQTAYALILCFDLCEEEERQALAEELAELVRAEEYACDFGHLGCKYVFRALSENCHADMAYRLATREEYPSFGYMLRQGATTLCEGWNMACSNNHHYFSGIGEWLYKSVAGILPDENHPGFRHAWIRPQRFEGIHELQASHMTPYGELQVGYRVSGEVMHYRIVIPVGCTATLDLPSGYRLIDHGGRLTSGSHELTVFCGR